MGVVTARFETLQADCPRVSVQPKADHRAGPASRLRAKTARVEEHSGASCAPERGDSDPVKT